MYSDTQAYSSDHQEKKLFLKQLFFFHIINKWCIEELLCEQWFNERNLSGERNHGWKMYALIIQTNCQWSKTRDQTKQNFVVQ